MRKAVLLATTLLILATACIAGTITVTSPTSGTTSTSPVHFVASASSAYKVSSIMIYVDNKAVYTVYSGSLNTYVPIGSGSHSVVLKSWDITGAMTTKSLSLTVSTSTTSSTSSPAFYNIDEMSGWQVCTACAGVVGVDDAPSSFTQYQGSPSMDSKSMKFWLGGTTPYRNALWYKGLGANSARHFTFDLYFYITNPNYSEALEFDLNQYIGGRKYIFAHQCSPKWSKTWDTWNQSTGHWESTGIACPVFPAYKWNHVVIEVERTLTNQLHYISITYNGVKHYVNRYRSSTANSWNGVSVDFQMDGDSAQHDYSTWLDKVKLSSW